VGALVSYHDVAVGTRFPDRHIEIPRETVIKFCGASLDFAGPHWNERIAQSVGWSSVIAHRGLIVEAALRSANDWTGDPTAVIDYHARFIKPVVVPDDGTGAVLDISGVIESKLDAKQVGVSLTVVSGRGETLVKIRAVVQLT
jgi:acyl dehydratase